MAEGDVRSTVVPAGRGVAISVRHGEIVRLTNTYGSQVVDLWALGGEDPAEHSSMDHTRSKNSNIFFKAGMTVYSSERRAMLTMIEDRAGLCHDTLLCPCNAAIYRELGCKGAHRSCTGNFHEALERVGLACPFTPASLNVFMNVPVQADGTVDRVPPASMPGDYVRLRAEMDLTLVLSACPQDVTPINGAERQVRDVHVDIAPAAPGGVA